MLYIGVMNLSDRRYSTVYFSSVDPNDDWEAFERDMQEFRHKDHRVVGENCQMPSDIAIGLLTNVLQAASIKYTRIDL